MNLKNLKCGKFVLSVDIISVLKTLRWLFSKIVKKQPSVCAITVTPQPPLSTSPLPTSPILPVDKEQAFIEALPVVIVNGFNPLIVYTHAYHESGAFKKLVGQYNYFGMKPPMVYDGKIVTITTHEFINGLQKKVVDKFCDFDNAQKCLGFYVAQIKRLYKEAYKNRNDYVLYFWWLTRDKFKWATDPDYSEKLTSLYTQLNTLGVAKKLLDKISKI